MPTIEVSAGAFTNFAYRLTFPAGVTTPGGNTSLELKGTPILGVFVNGRSVIRIYSGTRDSAWSASSAAIDANKLVEFISSTHYSTTIGPVISTVTGAGTLTMTTQVQTTFAVATQSGTASWFMLAVANGNGTGTTLYQKITGTVGVTGSGADLIISDTSITSGQQYKFVDLTFTFPSVFTYT